MKVVFAPEVEKVAVFFPPFLLNLKAPYIPLLP